MAHPAAVVPLNRWFPRLLSLDALIIGAMVPDSAYCFKSAYMDSLSHSIRRGIIYGLPVGILFLIAFRLSRKKLVQRLPSRELTFMNRPRKSTR